MRVAVIDVGSNTARLLVAEVADGIEPVREEKAFLGLAADIVAHGEIRRRKLRLAANVVRRYAAIAERLEVAAIEAVVTAPGRQGRSGAALVRELERASSAPVRVLSPVEEGRLAFAGALARARELPGVVAVCDVGGGSTELAVGTGGLGATWVRSADVGSLRLTRSFLRGDPPGAGEIAAVREAAREALAGFAPPPADVAIAVGGSARAAAKLVGRTLGADDLEVVVELAARRSSAKLARIFDLEVARAQTLLAGAVVLAEASRRLDLPFRLGRGGLREGAALSLAARAKSGAAAA
jgi:exopolyphosphatase/guanosine-5'-triphosphate,3'-diphosphate pyrophosphatase